MGDEDSALVDAGPILHLDEVGSLPLLQLFRTIHVPDGVWSETVGRRRIPGSRLLALGNLVRHSAPSAEVARFVRQHGLQALQGGERECLYLARDTGSTMLLTDDLAAREAAGRLGLAPVGSFGDSRPRVPARQAQLD